MFTVAGMVAGVAGALSVNQQGYVSPNVLHWTQSGTLMVMVILGGVATLWGGVIGAAALLLLQEVLSAYTPHWEFWTGWVLMAVVLFARQGWPACCAALSSRDDRAGVAAARGARLHKRFGGVVATDGVDLQVRSGEVHALIGPNGAGKTTLVAQLAGQLAPDSGRIVFDGPDITTWSAHQRARSGLARSFQITRLFKSFTVLEHLALALQAATGASWGAWQALSRDRELWERAHAQLSALGLWSAPSPGRHAVARPAARARSRHGRGRSAAAGAARRTDGRHGSRRVAAHGGADRRARAAHHGAADRTRRRCGIPPRPRVSVLVGGRIIASATPDEVRRDTQVIAAYLGQE